jgi:hypothetical protein
MGEQFPAILLNCLQSQACSVRPCVVTLKDDSFLLRTFFTKRTTKFVERLNVANCTDPFPFLQKVDQFASFTIPKESSRNLAAEGTVFGFFFWAMWCDATPRLAVLSLEVACRCLLPSFPLSQEIQ